MFSSVTFNNFLYGSRSFSFKHQHLELNDPFGDFSLVGSFVGLSFDREWLLSSLRWRKSKFKSSFKVSGRRVSVFCEDVKTCVGCTQHCMTTEWLQFMMHASAFACACHHVRHVRLQRDLIFTLNVWQNCVHCTHSLAQIAPWGPRDHRLPKGKERFPARYLKREPCGTCLAFSSTHWEWPVIWSH